MTGGMSIVMLTRTSFLRFPKRILKVFRHDVIFHEPVLLNLREILRLHDGRTTPHPRLMGDGTNRFPPSALCIRHHVASLRFPFKG
jgi:hypothetical protein